MQSMEQLRGKLFERNPLSAIGITASVLGLGLSNDEVYQYAQSVAKELMKMFHSDTRTLSEAETEAQRRFSEAFNALKDRAVFDQALYDLRTRKSEERTEVNQIRRDLEDVKSDRDRLKEKASFCVTHHSLLQVANERLQGRYVEHLSAPMARVGRTKSAPPPGAIVFTQCKQLVLLGMAVCPDKSGRIYYEQDAKLQALKARYDVWASKRSDWNEAGKIRTALKEGGFNCLNVDRIEDEMVTRYAMPAIAWENDIALKHHGMLKFAVDTPREFLAEQRYPDGIRMSEKELKRSYQSARCAAARYIRGFTKYLSYLQMDLQVCPVREGCIEMRGATYAVVGSIPRDNVPTPHATNSDLMLRDADVVDRIEPLFARQSFLIGVQSDKLLRVPADVGEARGKLLEAAKRFVGSRSRFHVLGVILDAELE